ncbi:reticulon-like protein B17 [Arachis duranensis]|uniref:Reticulon-like protein n=1 Tax=Arachis duranensis TaxID=130453 RepID=A0A6P4CRJ2_ARADU|nr:reticulon-like protein B17 [Arachis duranensis]
MWLNKIWQLTKTKTLILLNYSLQFNSTQTLFMEPSAPPYYHRYYSADSKSRSKSSSRLARVDENGRPTAEPLRISLDVVHSPTNLKPPPQSSSPSLLSLLRSPNGSAKKSKDGSYCLPIRELLLLSPSPARRSKPRFDSPAAAAEELPEVNSGLRRRCKSRGVLGSPRNSRRSRRRSEIETKEEKDVAMFGDEVLKQRKRRHSGRSKKERLSLVPFVPPSISSPKAEEDNGGDLVDSVGQWMNDLIMWKDVSKTTLWFGFGSLCFLSSCFTKGLNFSIFSAISQLATLLLGVSFISNSLCQRNQVEKMSKGKLKEDDILHLAKLILPALNFAISKTRELFSGEPSMTLKVAPFLLLGAEYGHLITTWRLCAIGFFVSFIVPKLYSSYSAQVNQRAECLKLRLLDTWNACTHKKIVVASALITFWNLSTVKTRVFTAFILLVIFKYFRTQVVEQLEDKEAPVDDKLDQQALLVAEPEEEKEPEQGLVVAKQESQI